MSKEIIVTISKELIKPREELLKTCWMCPSGAYLAWIELFGEEDNE